MNKKIKYSFCVLVTALSIVLPGATVMAAAPLDVHIEVEETIISFTIPEPFAATGPAVDAGVVCPTGEVVDVILSASGPPGGTFSILKVLKRFECDDGSGTFDVKMVVRLNLITNDTTAVWKVVGGTGNYVRLHSNGKLIGIPIVPGESILDIYDGRMH